MMTEAVPVAERYAEGFAGNRLLSTLDAQTRDQLAEATQLVHLDVGETVLRRGQNVVRSLFPFGRTMVSLVVDVDPRRSIEMVSIGREGAIGGIVSCGDIPAFSRAETIVPGPALAVPMHILEQMKARSPHLRNLFCRYADFLLAQIMQSGACNSFHPIDARAARWLLTADDRAGPRLELTQEALAGLLGVQRTTVNAVVGQLEAEGLIDIRRGAVEIRDRAGLERKSCTCYAAVERFFADVLGDDGRGGFRG